MGCHASAPAEYKPFLSNALQDRYDISQELLGKGSFGHVCAAWTKSTGEPRAIKAVPYPRSCFRKAESRACRRRAEQESAIWQRIGEHPHCVKLFEVFVDDASLCMVMERCCCSLLDALDKQFFTDLHESDLGNIFRQMLLGLSHVHAKNIIHLDVKPANFLLGGPDDADVKLSDFGLATIVPCSQSILSGRYGTPAFMSPEMTGLGRFSMSSDSWSMGVTAYLLLFGDFPFKCRQAIVKGTRPAFKREDSFAPPSRAALSFVESLLEHDVKCRIPVREALLHQFVDESARSCWDDCEDSDGEYAQDVSLDTILRHARSNTLRQTPDMKEVIRDTGSQSPSSPRVALPVFARPARALRHKTFPISVFRDLDAGSLSPVKQARHIKQRFDTIVCQ